jgi:PLP dependent protein
MTTIAANLQAVTAQILRACLAAARSPDEVRLLAVSKTRSVDDIRAAHAHGQNDFGENYVQEALSKIAVLPALTWHFIGPLQSNKTRVVAEHFAWVHSVDTLKLAERLSAQRPANLPPLNVCLQVNVSDEASKGGCTLAAAPALALAIAALPRLRLRGLMCIPAPCTDPTRQGQPFARVRELQAQLNAAHPLHLDTLSMGMSDDLDAAIQEGATMVRVGTAIFGARERR